MRSMKKGHVHRINREIPYTLIRRPAETNRLAVMLPGAGYTTQGPLLYYATGIMVQNGYDVLHVNYSYEKSPDLEEFQQDVRAVVNEVLREHTYEQFCFIAKSMGTVVLPMFVNEERFANASFIWLTPLVTNDLVYDGMLKGIHQSLYIIGDNDPYFHAERIEQFPEAVIMKGADHSLGTDTSVLQSIDWLKEVMVAIEKWVKEREE
ncbi:MAG: alpha/beta hydrolase [Bacillus sp. (in: Bacteria)]|nr:alpha/beta hydrolase [Bacillus sp. (in: firmicutes)]